MPRDKRGATIKENEENSKPGKTKLSKELGKWYVNTVEDEYQRKKAKLDTDASLFKVKTDLNKFVFNGSQCSASKTFAEFQNKATSIPSETLSFKSVLTNITKSVSKNPTRPRSFSHESTCTSRTSRSQVSIKKAEKTRLSKSLPRAIVQQYALTNNSNEPCTFANKGYWSTYGLVTTKVKPNTPSVVLSRPKQGEMATSMQGSPLIVGSVINENVANVAIPLGDGRISAIETNRGLLISGNPTSNEEIENQIKTLSDDFNRFCNL